MTEPNQSAEPSRTELIRDDAAGRYELRIDGEPIAMASFHEHGAVTTVPYTEVRADRRGHGIGAILVTEVLDDLRRRGHKVVPRCWYVAEFIEQHADYQDLLAAM